MIKPGATVGILGGGQLGRMMILAGRPLGYRFHVFEPSSKSCAGAIADAHTCAGYEEEEALKAFADQVDVVTLEFENIPLSALDYLEARVPLRPGKRALEVCQHRRREKEFLKSEGFPHVPYRELTRPEDLEPALEAIGYPAVLKTAAFGYDGKGQIRLDGPGNPDAESLWDKMGQPAQVVLEKWITFSCEISAICARSVTGNSTVFPIAENVHRNHILHQSILPARVEVAVAEEAARLARCLAEKLEVVGLLAVEFFVTRDGTVLINEMAPRPHNSGHYTQNGCIRSQFEQHLRMVLGLEGIPQSLVSPVVMTNLLGDLWPPGSVPHWEGILGNPGAHLHLYEKGEARPGRKMGHFNILGDDPRQALEEATRIWDQLGRA